MNEPFICPLCGSDEVRYVELKNSDRSTHAWICEPCPFVGFEFWQDEDADAITSYLKRS